MGLGDIIQGGIGGAMAGGSLGGGWGALGGGALGALLGGLGGNKEDEQQKRLQGFYNSLGSAPQTGPAYTGNYSDFRNNQSALIAQLEAMAQGRGPSLATQQLKTATDRGIAQQQGLAQSGMGNATFAQQQAMNNSARMGSQAAQDAAGMRIQEQMNALNMLGINIHGARGADENMNRFNASAQNQNMWGNRDATMENNRLRAAVLSGMGGNPGPSLGQQILAGGASMYATGATQNAAARANQTIPTPQQAPYIPNGWENAPAQWSNPNVPRY